MRWTKPGKILLLATMCAGSQGQNLNDRIQRLVPLAENPQVQTALNAHHYARVQQILASAPANEATRPEMLAVEGAVAFMDGDMHAAARYFTTANDLKPLSDGDSFTW